jgi:5-methylcytosine-specific restriction endonuclease McrA
MQWNEIPHETWVVVVMTRYIKSNMGSRQWREQRMRVLQRDQFICYWCGGKATHADHLITRKDGGGDELENLVAACARCNQKRGAKSIAVFSREMDTPLVFSSNLSPITTTKIPNSPFESPNGLDSI